MNDPVLPIWLVLPLMLFSGLGCLMWGLGKGIEIGRAGTRLVPTEDPDPMRIVEYRRVGHCTYEITTESRRYGKVTQRVLVLPGDAIEGNPGE